MTAELTILGELLEVDDTESEACLESIIERADGLPEADALASISKQVSAYNYEEAAVELQPLIEKLRS